MLRERCTGLLVREVFIELSDEISSRYPATRCLNCGDIEDAVICANHRLSPMAQPPGPHEMVRPAVSQPPLQHVGSM